MAIFVRLFFLCLTFFISDAAVVMAQPDDQAMTRDESVDKNASDRMQTPESSPRKPRLIETSDDPLPLDQSVNANKQDPDKLLSVQNERLAKLPEPLRKLATADHIFDIGLGGQDECSSLFSKLAGRTDLKSFSQDLLWITGNGSPAARLYAACLIRLFDDKAGRLILDDFKKDKTLVTHKNAVKQVHYTMAEIATDLLSSAPSIRLR